MSDIDLFVPLRSGLADVDKLEAGHGWAFAGITATPDGVMARAEVGHKLTDSISAFAAAEVNMDGDWLATAGVGGTW